MVDPFTAIGTSSAVIDIATVAWKVARTAYQIYEASSDADIENFDIQIHESLCQLDTSIQRAVSTYPLNGDDDLLILVKRCKTIGKEIAEILKATKTSKRSVGESLKTALKKLLSERKLQQLKGDLGGLMSRLQVKLHVVTQSQNGKTLLLILEKVQSNELEFRVQLQFLKSLQARQQLELEMLTQLQDFFIPPRKICELINQRRILDALNVPELTARFDNVHDATKDTFGWCISENKIPDSHKELTISFRDWLLNGQGVFHIEGKPGCGKSTLMKFIVDHKETMSLLQEWSEQKPLIVGSFFFWKMGTALQRNLEGLLRSLAHTILHQLPHLIPHIFPEMWDPQQVLPWITPNHLKFNYSEIQTAVNALMNHCALEDCYSCFFIDGLDEFENPDPGVDKWDLASFITAWASSKAKNIKFCVSSRKEVPFRENFSSRQRLQLHLLTESDIRIMVSQRLGEHRKFKSWPHENQNKLIVEILNRADGVFLWVNLVLAVIREALGEDQTLEYILERLRVIPEKLEEFFKQIIDSIPSEHKREAYAIFAIITTIQSWSLASRPNVLHFSFIENLIRNRIEIPAGKNSKLISSFDVAGQVKSFKSRLGNCCKGLVELQTLSGLGVFPDVTLHDLWAQDTLVFIHRSLAEYFENLQEQLLKILKNFDPRIAVIDFFIIELTLYPYTEYRKSLLVMKFSMFIPWLRMSTTTNPICERLGILEDTLLKWQHGSDTVKEINWTKFRSFSEPWLVAKPWEYLSVLAYSCCYGFTSFVEWSFENQPDLTTANQVQFYLLQGASRGSRRFKDRVLDTLSFLLKIIDPNIFLASQNHGLSVWQLNLFEMANSADVASTIQKYCRLIQHLLESGADPFVVYVSEKGLDISDYDMVVRKNDGREGLVHPFIISNKRLKDLSAEKSVTFRQLLKICQPSNMENLLDLIDRNMENLYPLATRRSSSAIKGTIESIDDKAASNQLTNQLVEVLGDDLRDSETTQDQELDQTVEVLVNGLKDVDVELPNTLAKLEFWKVTSIFIVPVCLVAFLLGRIWLGANS